MVSILVIVHSCMERVVYSLYKYIQKLIPGLKKNTSKKRNASCFLFSKSLFTPERRNFGTSYNSNSSLALCSQGLGSLEVPR